MKTAHIDSAITRKRPGQWRAFTLVELLISVVIMGILMTGLGSAILIATQALPDPDRASSKVIMGSRVAEKIAAELQEAVYIAERTAQTVTFTVADRDGDGSPERIRYAWSGTAGDPLTRQYNGGAVVSVLENTHHFDLAYDTKDVTEEYPGPLITSSEAILTQNASLGDSDFIIQEQDWVGQYFDPQAFLPIEAVDWSITKVEFVAKIEGDDNGWIDVQLRRAEGDGDHTPRDEVLVSKTRKEQNLPAAYQWVQMAFNDDKVQDMNPDTALCLVIGWDSRVDAAAIQYLANGGSDRVETTDAGLPGRMRPAVSCRTRSGGHT